MGDRRRPDGRRRYRRGPDGGVLVGPDRARTRGVRLRVARHRRVAVRRRGDRRGALHPDCDPPEVADRRPPRDPPDRTRRNHPGVRQPPALLLQLRGLPRGDRADRPDDGRAVRRHRRGRRVADRQRVRVSRHHPVLLFGLRNGVPRVVPRGVRHCRRTERGVGDGVLEPTTRLLRGARPAGTP